jgi:hypothetical protein
MEENKGNFTVEELRAEFLEKVAEIRKQLETINYLESRAGLPLTRMDELGQPSSETESRPPATQGVTQDRRGRPKPQIRPDEYLGLEPLRAAKSYMRRVGRAVEFDPEVADAVRNGGAAIKGADWKERLELGLTRSAHDVVKIRDGVFGLKELYTEEQLKGLRTSRNRASVKPKRRKSKRKKGKPSAGKKGKPEKKEKPHSEKSEAS